MDNLTTFTVKGRQYSVAKSDIKMSNVNYSGKIGHNEIQFVFDYLNSKNVDFRMAISKSVDIYNFIKFMFVDQKDVDNLMKKICRNFTFGKVIDYGVEYNQNVAFFKVYPFYTNLLDDSGLYLLKFSGDQTLKNLLIDTFINKLKNIDDLCLIKKDSTSEPIINMQKVTSIYYKMFGANIKTFKVNYYDNRFCGLEVNGKQIINYGNYDEDEIGYLKEKSDDPDYEYVYYWIGQNTVIVHDVIVNHIQQVLFGQVEL